MSGSYVGRGAPPWLHFVKERTGLEEIMIGLMILLLCLSTLLVFLLPDRVAGNSRQTLDQQTAGTSTPEGLLLDRKSRLPLTYPG